MLSWMTFCSFSFVKTFTNLGQITPVEGRYDDDRVNHKFRKYNVLGNTVIGIFL